MFESHGIEVTQSETRRVVRLAGDDGLLTKENFFKIVQGSDFFLKSFDKNNDGEVTEVRGECVDWWWDRSCPRLTSWPGQSWLLAPWTGTRRDTSQLRKVWIFLSDTCYNMFSLAAGLGQADQEAVQGWGCQSAGKTWHGRWRSAQLRGVQGAFWEGGQEEEGEWEERRRKPDPTSLSQGWCPVLSCRPWLNVSAKFAPNKHVKPSDLSNTVRHNFKQTLSQIEKNFCFKSSNEKIFYFHLHLTIFKMYISYNTIERECLYRNLSLVGSVFVSAFYVKAIFRANDWAHCVRTWSSSSSPCLISLESCWSCIFEVIFLFDDRTLSLSLYNKMILLHGIPDQAM